MEGLGPTRLLRYDGNATEAGEPCLSLLLAGPHARDVNFQTLTLAVARKDMRFELLRLTHFERVDENPCVRPRRNQLD